MKHEKITERQREFARLVAKGEKQGEAYRKAFNCMGQSEAAVRSNASRLAKNDNILRLIEELRERADGEAVMRRHERMVWLSRKVLEATGGEPAEVANGIRAIQELNRMDGAYAAEKVEAKVETCSFENILALIEERKREEGGDNSEGDCRREMPR